MGQTHRKPEKQVNKFWIFVHEQNQFYLYINCYC